MLLTKTGLWYFIYISLQCFLQWWDDAHSSSRSPSSLQVESTSVCLPAPWARSWRCHWTCFPREFWCRILLIRQSDSVTPHPLLIWDVFSISSTVGSHKKEKPSHCSCWHHLFKLSELFDIVALFLPTYNKNSDVNAFLNHSVVEHSSVFLSSPSW